MLKLYTTYVHIYTYFILAHIANHSTTCTIKYEINNVTFHQLNFVQNRFPYIISNIYVVMIKKEMWWAHGLAF